MATPTMALPRLEDRTATGGCAPRATPLRASATGAALGAAGWTLGAAGSAGAEPCTRYWAMTQPVVPPLVIWYQAVLALSATGPCFTATELPVPRFAITEPLLLGSVRTSRWSPSVFATRA